jgi:hypothetical protein
VQQIPLAAEPNQEFTVRLDDTRYLIRLKEANGVMVADFVIDDVVTITGTRVLAGEFLIPYLYMMRGNFVLLTVGDALPDWREFGASQTLVYMSPEEFAAL